jgi:hypothetical protein
MVFGVRGKRYGNDVVPRQVSLSCLRHLLPRAGRGAHSNRKFMSSRIHQLFGQALDQPEAQRLHWLRAQCGDDQPLFDAVTRLLRADAAASLLDGDVAELVEPLVTQSPDRDDRSFEERVGN